MHPYETEGRQKVAIFLATVSVFLVWILDIVLGAIKYEPQWWLSVPSFAGFYSLVCWTFDHHLWRLRIFNLLGLVKAPDLNGEWSGWVNSSYTQGTTQTPVSVVIRQRWSKMILRLETEHSRSHSFAATLKTDDLPYPEFVHLYVNEPKSNAQDSMNTHRGTAILEFKDAGLEGDYYTGRGRSNFGTMKLRRNSDTA